MNDLPVNAIKVFFTVIGTIKFLEADEALVWLLSTMNQRVPSEKVLPIDSVRTKMAFVLFAGFYRAASVFHFNCSILL